MKNVLLLCALILTANVSFAEPLVLNTKSEVAENYYLEAKKNEKYFFSPFGRDTIRTQVMDINNDNRDDILVTEENHCDRDTGCYWRIYLNLGKETDGPYCLSSEIDEEYIINDYQCLEDGWVTALKPKKYPRGE
ncbi:MAG: hypothetical protein JXK94_05435 [Deltaproteobacteria bacterium]|nr:hypothetical protein [Deltaproteobacteria bacterium]